MLALYETYMDDMNDFEFQIKKKLSDMIDSVELKKNEDKFKEFIESIRLAYNISESLALEKKPPALPEDDLLTESNSAEAENQEVSHENRRPPSGSGARRAENSKRGHMFVDYQGDTGLKNPVSPALQQQKFNPALNYSSMNGGGGLGASMQNFYPQSQYNTKRDMYSNPLMSNGGPMEQIPGLPPQAPINLMTSKNQNPTPTHQAKPPGFFMQPSSLNSPYSRPPSSVINQMQLQTSMPFLGPQMAQMQMGMQPLGQNQMSPQMQLHPGMKPGGMYNPGQQLLSMKFQEAVGALLPEKHPDLAIPVPEQ